MKKYIRMTLMNLVLVLTLLVGCGRQEDKKQMVKYNLFEEAMVSFDGVNGEGRVEYILPENMPNGAELGFTFDYDKNGELSNGDKLVLKLAYSDDGMWSSEGVQEYCKRKGVQIEEVEREYTVDGLYDLISSIEQVSDETKKQLEEEALNYFNNYVETKWENPSSYIKATLVGEALVSISGIRYPQGYVLIHKIDINDGIDEFSYYYYTLFYNVYVAPDGKNHYETEHRTASNVVLYNFRHNGVTYFGKQTIEEILDNMSDGVHTTECVEYKLYE